MVSLRAGVWILLGCLAMVTSASAQSGARSDFAKYSDKVSKKTFRDVSIKAAATQVRLIARPTRCVTLRQGQRCFIRLAVTWTSVSPISACLISDKNLARECWEQQTKGDFKADLYLSETTEWIMQDTNGQRLGDVEVTVAWVYDSRRGRRNWSLF